MQPVQNITVDDRVSRTQYQYTLEDPDPNELNQWTEKLVDKMKQLPELADVATDQQTGGLAVSLVVDRVTASRLGIAPTTIDSTLYDAYGQRQISTMYTQLNQYHVILETDSERQQSPEQAPGPLHPVQRIGGGLRPGASSSFASSGSSSAGSNATTSAVAYTPSSAVLSAPTNAIKSSVGSERTTSTANARPDSAQECRAAERVHSHCENHRSRFPSITRDSFLP